MTKIAEGTVLVPKETPFGPPAAREAWAEAMGNLLVVVRVHPDGGGLDVNVPSEGRTYARSMSDVLAEYEDPHDPDPFGRSWGAQIDRCAIEAARINPGSFEHGTGDGDYWRRVSAAVIRVHEEEQRGRAS